MRFLFLLRNILHIRRGAPWFPALLDIRPIPWISGAFIADGDAAIATSWPTASGTAALPASKGEKFYFVQHFEDWFGETRRLEETFRLPLRLITIAPWLTALMKERFARDVTAEIHNGIDLERFRPPPAKPAGPPSILMMHHVSEYKGTPVGLEALRRVHARFPDTKVRLFGAYAFPDREPWMEFVQDPSPDRLIAMYQESHIFLSPSIAEGWHLPPMEAMACGCAVVATNVGGVPDYAVDGETILAAPPRDPEALARQIIRLIENPQERERIAANGHDHIRQFTWEKAADKVETIFLKAVETGQDTIQ
jgi:glycosyltransferase involved in cell wall biosynthesis